MNNLSAVLAAAVGGFVAFVTGAFFPSNNLYFLPVAVGFVLLALAYWLKWSYLKRGGAQYPQFRYFGMAQGVLALAFVLFAVLKLAFGFFDEFGFSVVLIIGGAAATLGVFSGLAPAKQRG